MESHAAAYPAQMRDLQEVPARLGPHRQLVRELVSPRPVVLLHLIARLNRWRQVIAHRLAGTTDHHGVAPVILGASMALFCSRGAMPGGRHLTLDELRA
jgi:hypothetical protein